MTELSPAQTENKMGVMPVNRLLLNMALPMMLSMMVQALYNVVDSIFVSRISEDALTALSMAFPMQNLMIAAAVGFGVGINSLLSRALGRKDHEQVNRVAGQGLFPGTGRISGFPDHRTDRWSGVYASSDSITDIFGFGRLSQNLHFL